MSGVKRKFSDGDSPSTSPVWPGEIEIYTSLTSKRKKKDREDDKNLSDVIRTSVAKRSVREGAAMIKRSRGNKVTKREISGGSFQSMGLHSSLLRSLTLQGYRIPTPIQRLSIPALLSNPPRDLVGMARTGSGKSLAYIVPLIQRLGGRHSTSFGSRGLIILPTRELALQVMKVGKELCRGFRSGRGDHAGDKEIDSSKKGETLRWCLIVGGEGLDEQFEMITNNPDVIIATPGRLLHVIIEMDLDLKSIDYVIFDEADRLFELGFEIALNEILKRLNPARQTMLFSATLPKSLLEFAKAGLKDPKLVRLDADGKISSDLKMAFFSVKQTEKDACLLSLLRDIIKVPYSSTTRVCNNSHTSHSETLTKSKRSVSLTPSHQTLIFTATKHHVEYLLSLLTATGYSVSYIYGSLDQAARTFQMDQFRNGITSILVVTDVAARGIDIPVLENVINYDFPQGSRVFVHRVGRTARAGRQGWAWSFVTNSELPFLLDLQLFLGRSLANKVDDDNDDAAYVESLVLGNFGREKIDEDMEYIRSLDAASHSLSTLREVMKRGHAMYERSKGKASTASYRRAKEMVQNPVWCLAGSDSGLHPILKRDCNNVFNRKEDTIRKSLLKKVNLFSPFELVFEIGSKGRPQVGLMNIRRNALKKSSERVRFLGPSSLNSMEEQLNTAKPIIKMAYEDDVEAIFNAASNKGNFRDEEFYIPHHSKDAFTEKGYSLSDGVSSFIKQAQNVSFDLRNDDVRQQSGKVWDKKKKRFIQGDRLGADNIKMIRTENGTRLPATFRSGRFDEWKSKSHISLPTVGEAENTTLFRRGPNNTHRFKHNNNKTAKPLDKLRKDYDRKLRQLKKVKATETSTSSQEPKPRKLSRSSTRTKVHASIKSELQTSEQIRKHRRVAERRRAKNSRPGKFGKGK